MSSLQKLKTSDNIIFEVSEIAAMQSGMIKGLMLNDCEDDKIHNIIEVEKDKTKEWDVEFVNKDQSLLY